MRDAVVLCFHALVTIIRITCLHSSDVLDLTPSKGYGTLRSGQPRAASVRGEIDRFYSPRVPDHVIILGARHLRPILTSYLEYYHRSRTHLGLVKDTPELRAVQRPGLGAVVELPEVGGLHR